MNVGFDLDGVLYDWHRAVYNDCVSHEDYEGSFREFWTGYFQSFPRNKQKNFCYRDPLYSSQIPSKKLLKFLDSVAKEHEIFYVTARSDECYLTTKFYMERYNFPYSYNLVLAKDKATIIKLHRIDIFIDDFPSNLDEIGSSATTFLIKKPWNEEVMDNYNTILSVFDLEGVLLSEH